MSTIKIRKVGITKVGTECIVNAANEGLWEGGGVCGIIFKAAGSTELTKACQKIGHCDTGSAVITPAFNLNAKYIIHAVGPVWKDGNHKEPQQLYGCYKKSLELAKEHGCHSIGFPLISAGIFGYPVNKAWRKAIQACNDFITKNPDYDMKIVFAVIDDQILDIGKDTLKGLNIENDEEEIKVVKTIEKDLHPKDIVLLKTIDKDQLKESIELFLNYTMIVRGLSDEKLSMDKPIEDYLQLMEPDFKYKENYEMFCRDELPTEMNARQIQTMLTYIQRGEHFECGVLEDAVLDGSLLKILLRLDDLLSVIY